VKVPSPQDAPEPAPEPIPTVLRQAGQFTRLKDAVTLAELDGFLPHVTTPVTDPVGLTKPEPDMISQGIWLPDLPYTFQRTSALSGTEPITSDRLLISPTQFNASHSTTGRLRRFKTMIFEVSYVDPPKAAPQVLGCGILQSLCNWFSGRTSVSKKPQGALASQAIGPAQAQETLVLSTVVMLQKNLPLNYVDVSATYTVDGISWQKVQLARGSTLPPLPGAQTIRVGYTAEVPAPTWPLPEFAAFFEFKDQASNVLVATPRAIGFHRLFLPVTRIAATPDLVGSISLNPNKRVFVAGEPAQISVIVTNTGNGDAGPFWVDLFINPSAPPTASNIIWNERCALEPCFGITWSVPGLAVGESITLTSNNFPPGYSIWPGWFAAGMTDLYLYVDSWNPGVASGAVAESSESNNAAHLGGLTVTGKNPPFASAQSTTRLPARPAP
jgi:hypothetical protein